MIYKKAIVVVAVLFSVLFPVFATADTWTTKAPLLGAQYGPASGVINGQLYVASGASTFLVEAYDPTANTWTSKAPIPTARAYAGADVINGKLYVVGGCAAGGDCRIATTGMLEIYDPLTNSWTTGTSMPTARNGVATGAIDGKLYAAGGSIACPPCGQLTTVEMYDPVTNTWVTKAPMPTATTGAVAGVVNGKLYVAGGAGWATPPSGWFLLSTLQVYDPATDTWSTKTSMPTARVEAAAGVINDIFYVAGGGSTNTDLTTLEAYDPATNTWSTKTPMTTARAYGGYGVINGVLYDAGGRHLTTVEAFTPTPAPATPVGYNPQWLIITLFSLTIAGGVLLRRRMARQ